jgi:hypothetical protein
LWTGDSLERLIQQEKSAVDYLVVSVEWGATNTAVSDRQREIATRSIVSGADAVVGYGPHVVQDDSTINGKPVLYSLGDFVGSRTYRGVAPVSMVAVLTFNPRGSITVDRFASDKDALKAPGALRPFQERDAVVRLEPKQKFTCPVPTGKSISLRFVSFPRTEPIAAYTPPDLVVIPSSYTEGANVCATAKAYEAFVSLHDAMEDAGLDLSVTYGFRDTDSQEALIASFAQQGKKSFVAPVGQSEHVLGTAFDFASGSTNFFGSSPEYTFLKEHGHEFGFVQSYQGDPQDETHIPREPWHWRYVGTGIATALKKSGLPINLFLKSY